MAAEAGVNSYVSRADATGYLANRLDAEAWTQADPARQEAALVTATRRIDMQRLRGVKADPDQPLQFPRRYHTAQGWVVESEPPQAVRDATCEEALALLAETDGDRTRRRLMEAGVTQRSVGDASESYDLGALPRGLLSPEARRLLAPYLAGAVFLT